MADETFKIEALWMEMRNMLVIMLFSPLRRMKRCTNFEDLEHFVSKLTVDSFFSPDLQYLERVIILFENYSHL